MTFDPTPEQVAIVDAARKSRDNLLVSALAGAAKTSTLVLVANVLRSEPILSLAFNKRIAEEMTARLPSHVKSATLNSLGHRVWAERCGRNPTLNVKKSFELLREETNALPARLQKEARDGFAETLRAIGAAKLAGYVPGPYSGEAQSLVGTEIFDSMDEDVNVPLVNAVLRASIAQAFDGRIDFDDQIYMPTIFGGNFPRFPLVMVDEAQDLSPLNHAMLDKLVTKRLIAVGDDNQSIYAFRGADQFSMARLRERFNMREMHLTLSFRCPEAIVALARKHAPAMRAWNDGGTVTWPKEWTVDDVPENSAIICRNNAPLFSAALTLLRLGRGIKLVGSDLGPSLVRTLKKLGNESMTQAQTITAIDKWEAARLAKSRAREKVHDKAECLRVFAAFGGSLGGAVSYVEHLFKSTGTVSLLTGHKAKGLEWDNVFHLDPWRLPAPYAETPGELRQEANLEYVITTRAKHSLSHVSLKELVV